MYGDMMEGEQLVRVEFVEAGVEGEIVGVGLSDRSRLFMWRIGREIDSYQ